MPDASEPMAPDEIKALREREQVSQPVFASYLNVRKDAVSKWERGEKRPDGPSLKLLSLVKAKGLRAIAEGALPSCSMNGEVVCSGMIGEPFRGVALKF